MATFTGFDTSSTPSARRAWVLQDKELIKQDLLKHFYTRRGERVMRPDFGSNLLEYVMEPNTEAVRGEILAEVNRIVSLDSRLAVRSVNIFDKDYQVVIAVDLFFRPFNDAEVLRIEFDKRQE